MSDDLFVTAYLSKLKLEKEKRRQDLEKLSNTLKNSEITPDGARAIGKVIACGFLDVLPDEKTLIDLYNGVKIKPGFDR